MSVVLVEEGADAGVPWHYGAPLREQRWLEAGRARVWLPQFAVCSLAAGVLDGFRGASQSSGLAGSQVWWAAGVSLTVFADAQGQMWGFCERDQVCDVFSWLGEAGVEAGDLSATHDLVFGAGFLAIEKVLVSAQLGDCRAGTWAFDALRIEAGVPRPSVDCFHQRGEFYPAGGGKLTALNGERLVRLSLDGTDEHLPAPGTPITAADGVVGWLGSSAIHHELGPIALAVVGAQVKDSSPVVVDGVPGLVEALA